MVQCYVLGNFFLKIDLYIYIGASYVFIDKYTSTILHLINPRFWRSLITCDFMLCYGMLWYEMTNGNLIVMVWDSNAMVF